MVVNVINPGVGIKKELVEDARQEGSEAVENANNALDPRTKKVTWTRRFDDDELILNSKSSSGVSNLLSVPSGHSTLISLSVQQTGTAKTPATVQIFWAENADEELQHLVWEGAGGKEVDEFVVGLEPDLYTKSVPLPDTVRLIRLDYVAQEGGASSTLSAELTDGPPTISNIFINLVLMLFTNNLLGSMVEVNLLPIIIFSIVFAGMLTTMGKRSEVIANLVISTNDALMSFILLLMKVAPLGIFCLVASRFGKAQNDGQFVALLQVQFYYMLTVISGLTIHALITLPLILWIVTRRNPYRFMMQMSQAILTAFSTASSTATLPVTMECAETRAGVSKRSTEFVLPLGATINMDGTALYEAAAAIFIAQAYSVVNPEFQLTFVQQATIAVTATLAAIGAAGIPEAGLVTMLIVLNAVNLPLELIGLILPVDWLLDRFRTAVNAFGDSVGAAVVDRSFSND
ncbi:MAG TPA: dicarboxylate/amino acid:cation symporter [Planctomycetes bacterium]|nr:dicarboxylate/amino acid:cation symporter [Planctomycetaceae bacterium]HIM30038.1 dicarboxylate/amino acid:cation symporter [Planctomycetota bacterium]